MLSILRVLLVPAFAVSIIFMRDIAVWGQIVPAIIYALTALTDMLDGKIARKYNLVTDFGKFIDPLADKFMVIGSQVAILTAMLLTADSVADTVWCIIFTYLVLIILLRELGVTSLRLVVAGKSGIVVAASMLGKIKTVFQMVFIMTAMLEPVLYYAINLIIPLPTDINLFLAEYPVLTLTTMIFALVFIYGVMRFYTYLMMVTFDMKLGKIFKNALIFTVMGFKRNILALLGMGLLSGIFAVLIIFLGQPIPAFYILPFLCLLGFCGFMYTFAAYPVIEKYMIAPPPAKVAETAADGE